MQLFRDAKIMSESFRLLHPNFETFFLYFYERDKYSNKSSIEIRLYNESLLIYIFMTHSDDCERTRVKEVNMVTKIFISERFNAISTSYSCTG